MRNKLFTKIIMFALIAVFMLSAAACNTGIDEGDKIEGILDINDVVPEGATVIRLGYYKAGYGDGWMRQYCGAYHKMHPDVYFMLEGNVSIDGTLEGRLRAAESGAPIADLFTTLTVQAFDLFIKNGWVEDLTDVYGREIEGGHTMLDLLEDRYIDYANMGGSMYVVPWVNAVTGFIYNKKMFDRYGWELPETMEDLITLFSRIKTDTNGTVDPMVFHGQGGGYFNAIAPQWFAQYQGEEGIKEFYKFESAEIFKMPGRLEMFRALQTLFSDKSNFSGSVGGFSHTAAQTAFLDGEAAIISNGSWLETEMEEYLSDPAYADFEMAFMPLPKVYASKSGDTLLDVNGDEVKDYNSGQLNGFFIPKRSQNKEIAKDFLLFMHTQKNLKLFVEYAGAPRPFEILDTDTSYLSSAFKRSVMELYQKSVKISDFSHAPIYLSGELDFSPNNGAFATKIFNGFNIENMVNDEYNYAVQRFAAFEAG